MIFTPQLLLLGSVVAVGILHTIVPDHWVPIALLARQEKWSKKQTARAALQAGVGHVASTLLIALVFWIAGVAIAVRFGNIIDTLSGIALVGFGLWITIASWRELHEAAHHHDHEMTEKAPSKRTALLLILGSSPMVEGIPAFFAASRYGVALILLMALFFALSTIITYIILCVYSAAGLNQVRFPAIERYGEVISGTFIALIGLVFLALSIL